MTGWLSSWNTCMRVRMVSSLSSARPDVAPRASSRSTATSSGTLNTSTPSHGLICAQGMSLLASSRPCTEEGSGGDTPG